MSSTILESKAGLPGAKLFDGLTKEELGIFLAQAERYTFASGHVILEQGARSDRFSLIIDGQALVVRSDERQDYLVAVLGSGETVGEMGLLNRDRRNAWVIAQEDTTVLSFDCRALNEISPSLVDTIFRNIARIIASRPLEGVNTPVPFTLGEKVEPVSNDELDALIAELEAEEPGIMNVLEMEAVAIEPYSWTPRSSLARRPGSYGHTGTPPKSRQTAPTESGFHRLRHTRSSALTVASGTHASLFPTGDLQTTD